MTTIRRLLERIENKLDREDWLRIHGAPGHRCSECCLPVPPLKSAGSFLTYTKESE